MATTVTITKTAGPHIKAGIGVEYEFTCVLDTTTAGGIMTIDVTSYFDYLHSVQLGGSLAANFYYVEVQKPALATATTSTNLALGFSEAGADGAVLDLMNATDMSAAITGLTITVCGKPAIQSSWA
jgi:hypothetical protein